MIGDTVMPHMSIDSVTSRIVLGILTGFLGVSAIALPTAGSHSTDYSAAGLPGGKGCDPRVRTDCQTIKPPPPPVQR